MKRVAEAILDELVRRIINLYIVSTPQVRGAGMQQDRVTLHWSSIASHSFSTICHISLRFTPNRALCKIVKNTFLSPKL